MNPSTIPEKLASLLAPHGRAEALIDHGLGAELSREESAWLDAHLARCGRCRGALEARTAMRASLASLGERAPQGFSGRVLMAAKARGHEALDQDGLEARSKVGLAGGGAWDASRACRRTRSETFRRVAGVVGAGLAALSMVALFQLRAPSSGASARPAEALSGGSTLQVSEAPHFVVRAPGIGAAKARLFATEVVRAHGGTFSDRGGAIEARIPRSALIPVTQDLARRAPFRMTRVEAVELAPEVQTIAIRFELE